MDVFIAGAKHCSSCAIEGAGNLFPRAGGHGYEALIAPFRRRTTDDSESRLRAVLEPWRFLFDLAGKWSHRHRDVAHADVECLFRCWLVHRAHRYFKPSFFSERSVRQRHELLAGKLS